MSHLKGRFSASSWRFLWAGRDCSRTFLPQISHSTMLCSNSTTTGFEPLFWPEIPLFTVLVVLVPPDGASVTFAIRFCWLVLVFWRTWRKLENAFSILIYLMSLNWLHCELNWIIVQANAIRAVLVVCPTGHTVHITLVFLKENRSLKFHATTVSMTNESFLNELGFLSKITFDEAHLCLLAIANCAIHLW